MGEAAGTESAASLSAQQGFVAGYLLQDILRLREQGHRASPAWIKRHGVLVGLVGDNRKLALRLARRSRCLACAVELPSGSTGDHVIALAAGGPAGAENYLPLCGRCNASKGGRRTSLPGGARRDARRSSSRPTRSARTSGSLLRTSAGSAA